MKLQMIRQCERMSTPEVWLTMGCDSSVDVQDAIVVSRAVICESSGEGSMVRLSMFI